MMEQSNATAQTTAVPDHSGGASYPHISAKHRIPDIHTEKAVHCIPPTNREQKATATVKFTVAENFLAQNKTLIDNFSVDTYNKSVPTAIPLKILVDCIPFIFRTVK